MQKFLLLSDDDKEAYFGVVADKLNVIPQMIEKDFWVCWILKILFSLPESGSHLTFKGGTSLSKCYNIIHRFSEDIDVSIERSFFASAQSIEPDKDESGKENQRRLDRLKIACQEKIVDVIMPELRSSISAQLSKSSDWLLELDQKDVDKQTVLFTYPGVIKSSMGNYVQPIVKIEFGARSDHWPIETMNVQPYVTSLSNFDSEEEIPVRVLGAERTFWEKATILHAVRYSSKVRVRMSRHYYDVFEMVHSAIFDKAIQNIDLLMKVAEHKDLFFKENKARYDLAKPGSLRLLPQKEHVLQLKGDYENMQTMFFEDPPAFDEILEKLKTVEGEINRI